MHRLLNEGWEFREVSWEKWLPAVTPGHVHLDLLRNGVIAHPFDRMHEQGVQWVDETDWEYRLKFSGSEGTRLRFEGLDTVCEICLNGEQIGSGNNMFVPIEIDVAGRLQEENELLIRFASPRRIARERKAKYFAESGLADDTVTFYDWTFLRKAPYMFGWDWGPKLASCGIWKPVALLDDSPRIESVWPRQVHDKGRVTLRVEAEGQGAFRHHLIDPDGREWRFSGGEAVVIEEPRLWWPKGEGEQPLYTLVTQLMDGEAVLDERTQLVGLRTVELAQQPDRHGTSFEFKVNGRPIWARGANWIPDDSFPSILTKDRIYRQIERAAEMNCNMLRVWGGGLYESSDFYDACAEYGILVWQDFAFACTYSPDSEDWMPQYRIEAEHAVKTLRGHAALALWCGNNECQTMWEGKWGGADKSPDRFHGQAIWEELLPEVVSQLDPDRQYIPTSPMGVEGSCNDGGHGDQHYWDVWHGRGDWVHYADSTGRFSSEFGFASSPSLAVWQKHLAAADLHPRSEQVRWHDKTLKGYDTYLGYAAIHYPEIQSMEDLVYYTQLNQRDAMRFALEHYRCSDFCRGALIWQFNDCWPVQSWSLIDSEKRLKFAGHEMRRCFAPQMLAILDKGERVEIWAINDGPESFTFGPHVRSIRTSSGAVVRDEVAESLTLASNERACLLTLPREPGTLVVVDGDGVRLRASRLIGEPKDTDFDKPRLLVQQDERGIALTALDAPVIDLWLYTDPDTAAFSHNALTVLEGETVVVGTQADLKKIRARCLGHERVELVEG